MINKSFQLLRTNPLLTTNLKVVVTSDYNLYLESFNTNAELSNVKYKHYKMSKFDHFEKKIPYFYKGLPSELAFDIRYDDDDKMVQTNYSKQFDTTYFAGAGYVEDQWYSEEFDYFAPLYIRKNNLPSGFVILRVDEPSGYNINASNNFEFESLSPSNFQDIVYNWKCVKFFDMSYETALGEWIHNNYINNDRFPISAFEYNPERAEFSFWHGIDYTTGIYTHKPIFMDDRDSIETPHFKWEKFLTEGYKQSGLIFPYILNLKFLFDDTPATPSSLRKYSMNRYYGFYVEQMEYVGSITSYRTPEMIPDTYLMNNIILTGITEYTEEQRCKLEYWDVPSVNPFVEKWDDSKEYFVFIDNTSNFNRDKTVSGLYQVTRTKQNNQWIYKVISDEILDNFWNTGYTNLKTVDINYNTHNILSGFTSDFFIDKYIDCNENLGYMYGDLYLINIDDKFHVIKYSSGSTEVNDLTVNSITGAHDDWKFYIQTDYAINLNSEFLEYWILGKNSDYYRKYPVNPKGFIPITFPIYRVKFSDIKDFDFDRLNTNFADFDFEKTEYSTSPEEKLFAFNYNDDSIPPDKISGKLGYSGQYGISAISSEYIADDELYEVIDLGQQNTFSNISNQETKIYELNEIWRKNQSIVKWGFMGSISHSDYPYKLNNNYEVGGPYNRTTDPFSTIPDVNSKNMDYFYRLGNFYDSNTGQSVYYRNQSTNIQWDYISGQLGNGFDVEAYFGGKNRDLNFDYFTFFFKNKMRYQESEKLYNRSYDKYAVFNFGDENVSSMALFKGLKIRIKEVSNIYTNDIGKIDKILFGNKSYNDYKISIVFNENYNGNNSGLINSQEYVNTNSNSVNIILNEKHQNILVIINAKINSNGPALNDINSYDEKGGLYYGEDLNGVKLSGYEPKIFVASNFINAINDYTNGYNLSINYYYIKEDEIDGKMKFGQYTISTATGVAPSSNDSTMQNVPDWPYSFTPFVLNIELPTEMMLYNNCYSTYPFYVDSVNDDYVATIINFDDSQSEKTSIYRFSGPYEPIFKDINVFRGGFFCYNDINTTINTIESTGETYANQASELFNTLAPTEITWSNFQSINGYDEKYVELNTPPSIGYPNDELYSRILVINGFDFQNLPSEAIITGLTLTVSRRSLRNQQEDFYTRETRLTLAKDCSNYSATSADYHKTETYDPQLHTWSEEFIKAEYGGQYDLWETPAFTGLIGADILDSKFGMNLQVKVKNSRTTDVVLPQIMQVSLKVNFIYTGSTYEVESSLYFDSNYKFDTQLNDFGKMDEIICSKVNDKINPLNNTREIFHIYPRIDNFGYGVTDRFVFKSSWDKEFFIRTEPTLKEISGNV